MLEHVIEPRSPMRTAVAIFSCFVPNIPIREYAIKKDEVVKSQVLGKNGREPFCMSLYFLDSRLRGNDE